MSLTATVSVSMKINLGNYQSQDIFDSISGLEPTTTPEEVRDFLAGSAQNAYEQVCKQVERKALALKSPNGSTAPALAGGTDSPAPAKISVLSKPKREFGPKMVWAPKIDHLRRQELAIFVQLRAAEWPESAGTDTPEGSVLRESLRAVLMGADPFDRDSEKDMERWLQALAKHRDEVLPVTEAGL